MSVVDRLLGRPQNSILENPQYPLTSQTLLDVLHIGNSASSIHVTEKTAVGMAAVWRAVNLIASTGASLPLHPYKAIPVPGRDDPIRQLQTTGQAAKLLSDPNPTMTPYELWELSFAHVALWGNSYHQVLRDQSGGIAELWPICPWRVRPGRASDGSKMYQVDGEEGFFDVFDPDASKSRRVIFHIPGFGYDGIAGLSPIAAHRQGIGLALAAEEFGARLFGNGTMAGGILTTEQRLNATQADALKTRWKAKLGGLQNSHEVAILDAGAKFQQLTIPPEDAQFLESRRFQVEEIARMYGVPPHLLMAVDKTTSWGAGIEEQTLGFVKFSMRGTWLTRFEQRVTKLIGPGTVYAKYALEGLLRGDSAQRASFYTAMWQMGAMSTNEIRALEDLPPVDGGDQRYRPLNYGALGTTDTSNQTTGAPAA